MNMNSETVRAVALFVATYAGTPGPLDNRPGAPVFDAFCKMCNDVEGVLGRRCGWFDPDSVSANLREALGKVNNG
jgi:hypothetical protein